MSYPVVDISQHKKPVLTKEQIKIAMINSNYDYWGDCVFANNPKMPNTDADLDLLFIRTNEHLKGWVFCLYEHDIENAIQKAEWWKSKLTSISIVTTPEHVGLVSRMASKEIGIQVADSVNGLTRIVCIRLGGYTNNLETSNLLSLLTDKEKTQLNRDPLEFEILDLIKERYRKDFHAYMTEYYRLSLEAFEQAWGQS